MLVSLLSAMVYLLAFLLDLAALILLLEMIFFYLPGLHWNGIRRALFKVCDPLLTFAEPYLLMRCGKWNLRGLLLAVFLFVVSYFATPWLAMMSYSLRN